MAVFLQIIIFIVIAFSIYNRISNAISSWNSKKLPKKEFKPVLKDSYVPPDAEELKRTAKENFNDFYKELFSGKRFENKYTRRLENFVVTKDLNQYDIHKLAQLNNIKVEFDYGWNELVIELINELHKKGWNKQAYGMSQDHGVLYFEVDDKWKKITEKYIDKAAKICERCGKPKTSEGFDQWNEAWCYECLNN